MSFHNNRHDFDLEPRKYSANFPTDNPGKERGGCLTAWLGVGLVLNVVVGGVAFLQVLSLYGDVRLRPYIPHLTLFLLGALVAAYIVGLVATWNWKKWGVYLMVITIIIGFFVQYGPMNFVRDILGPIIQLVILYFLVSPKWEMFE